MLNNTVTVKEMKEIERKANEAGHSYYQMMENAGTGSYELIMSKYPSTTELLIFCGKGNNGGDGLVVARLAANAGKKVSVILVEGEPVTSDALTNYNKLPDTVEILKFNDFDKTDLLARVNPDNKDNLLGLVIVDALYGTGFHGELRKDGLQACQLINEIQAPVVALDIPSGCNADSKVASEGAVYADNTVVFHAYKNVHMPAIENCGECTLVNIM